MKITAWERRQITTACERGERRLGVKYLPSALPDRCGLIAETVLDREPIPWTWPEVARYLVANGREAVEEYIRQQYVVLWAIAHGVPWWIPRETRYETTIRRLGEVAFLLNGVLIERERWQVIAIGWTRQRLPFHERELAAAWEEVTAPACRRPINL